MKWLIILPLLAAQTLAVPTFPLPSIPGTRNKDATFQEVLENVWDSSVKAGYSKAAVLQFMGDTSYNAAAEGIKEVGDYIKSIDLEANVNATEEAIKDKKLAMITQIFGLKRQALRLLESIKDQYAATLNGFFQASLGTVLQAVNTAQVGLVYSKEAVFNMSNAFTLENFQDTFANAQENLQDTIENAQETMENATNAIGDAIQGSAQVVSEAGNNILESIIDFKQELSDAAENFSSQEAFHNGAVNVGVAINASINGVQQSVQDFGVFDAMDDIVQTVVGGLPEKINSIIGPVGPSEDTIVVEVEEPIVDDERPEVITDDEERPELVRESNENFEPIESVFVDDMIDDGEPVVDLSRVGDEIVVSPDVEEHVEAIDDSLIPRSDEADIAVEAENAVDFSAFVPRSFEWKLEIRKAKDEIKMTVKNLLNFATK